MHQPLFSSGTWQLLGTTLSQQRSTGGSQCRVLHQDVIRSGVVASSDANLCPDLKGCRFLGWTPTEFDESLLIRVLIPKWPDVAINYVYDLVKVGFMIYLCFVKVRFLNDLSLEICNPVVSMHKKWAELPPVPTDVLVTF